MKKILMLTAAALTLASANPADAAKAFNGWSVGLNGGWNQDRAELNFSGDSLDKKETFNSGFAGIHFDWTTSKANSFLFGLGFGIGYGFGSPTTTLAERGAAVGADTFVGKAEVELKRGLSGEINTRLGWNFNDKWALYAIFAARAQSVKLTAKLTGNGGTVGGVALPNANNSENDVVYGFAPGVGFDVRINEAWSIGAQYRYFFESSAKAKFSGNDKSHKLRAHNALVRVSYHF